jgi:3-oxoacyl-[acyl-carrier protein] reductase
MVDAVNELAGKVAIVTGSARNIGRSTAVELARAGASLVINARQSHDLCEEVAQEIKDKGGRALPYVADITDPGAVDDMVAAAVAEFGRIDILVNNAATRNSTPFREMDLETWNNALGVALHGAFLMSRACVPEMVRLGGGAIIGVGGMSSYRGTPERSHIMAAKSGLAALMRGLALDLGKSGITANSVIVGTFDTEREGSSSVVPTFDRNIDIPLGRKGVPQDIANLIRFLVGPGASYISGQTIHCNGGAFCPM